MDIAKEITVAVAHKKEIAFRTGEKEKGIQSVTDLIDLEKSVGCGIIEQGIGFTLF